MHRPGLHKRVQQIEKAAEQAKDEREGKEGTAFQRLKDIAQKGPVAFCKEALGFVPTNYQAKFLEDKAQFIAQLWSRQSGKDHSASSKLFWFAGRP